MNYAKSRNHTKMKYSELRIVLRNRSFLLGILILTPIVLIAVFAPFITPYDPIRLSIEEKLLPLSWKHPFGTDEFGRDILSRIVYGSRISLRVGGITAIFVCLLGILLGSVSGYYRKVDVVMMRIVDGLIIFPGLLLGIMIMAAVGPSEMNVILAMTILYTPRIARVVRASVLEAKTMDYTDAARVLGLGNLRILFLHILPNCLGPVIVQVTFGFAWAIMTEAGMSFLGLGTPPPAPSWGNIISDGREFIRTAPWIMMFPGIMISITVLGLNLIGDGLRDILDPRLRHTIGTSM